MWAENIRRKAKLMKDKDAVEMLLNIVEIACVEHRPSEISVFMQAGFTPVQSQLLVMLTRAYPHCVPHSRMCQYRHDGEITDIRTLGTQVCILRRQIRALGWPMQIKTHWGEGYSIQVADGWRWPTVDAPAQGSKDRAKLDAETIVRSFQAAETSAQRIAIIENLAKKIAQL